MTKRARARRKHSRIFVMLLYAYAAGWYTRVICVFNESARDYVVFVGCYCQLSFFCVSFMRSMLFVCSLRDLFDMSQRFDINVDCIRISFYWFLAATTIAVVTRVGEDFF